MGDVEWERRGFTDPNTPHLFCTNKDVQCHNCACIKKLKTPIAFIRAEHTGKGSSGTKDTAQGLAASLYLAVGAKVLVTINVAQPAGICNGSFGIVTEIVYDADVRPPALPRFVLVDLGDLYTGPSFFPDRPERRGWVPIHPVETSWQTPDSDHNFVDHSRKMLPLTTAWAFTIWKGQGQTFTGPVVLDIGKDEREHGLAYVAFSRATRFSNIGIANGVYFDRLTRKIKNQSKMKCRLLHEKHLESLYQDTILAMDGYTYIPSNPSNL
jgi:ATP-dependent exoDNAse (exonuclease V) alpha subunit